MKMKPKKKKHERAAWKLIFVTIRVAHQERVLLDLEVQSLFSLKTLRPYIIALIRGQLSMLALEAEPWKFRVSSLGMCAWNASYFCQKD